MALPQVCSTEVIAIGGDGPHRLGRQLEQEIVDDALVLVGDVGDLGRQREHDMEVWHGEQFGLPCLHPFARNSALALRTMPVAAGVVGNVGMAAGSILATRHVTAERCRAATLDGRHDLQLIKADMPVIGITPSRTVIAEDIRDLQCRSGHDPNRLGVRIILLAFAQA